MDLSSRGVRSPPTVLDGHDGHRSRKPLQCMPLRVTVHGRARSLDSHETVTHHARQRGTSRRSCCSPSRGQSRRSDAGLSRVPGCRVTSRRIGPREPPCGESEGTPAADPRCMTVNTRRLPRFFLPMGGVDTESREIGPRTHASVTATWRMAGLHSGAACGGPPASTVSRHRRGKFLGRRLDCPQRAATESRPASA